MITVVISPDRPLVSSINRIKPIARGQGWVALLRSDYALTTRYWFNQLSAVVARTPFALLLTACSSGPSWQRPSGVPLQKNMIQHRRFGAKLAEQPMKIVAVSEYAPSGSEGLVLMNETLLDEVRWGDQTLQGVAIRCKGSIGLIPNLYVVQPCN